jgi:hypothetical protein
MAFLYFSTWLFNEQLRLFHEVAIEGCRWWKWSLGGAGPLDRPARACRPAPPSDYFERLVGVARRMVGHASFPGKHEALSQCLEEVDDLIASGTITAGQGALLAQILSGGCELES